MRNRTYICVMLLALLGACDGTSATEHRADRSGTGDYGRAGISELDQIAWKWRANAAITSPPAATEESVYVASADGLLTALKSRDGVVRWQAELGAPAHGAPVVLASRVLAGTDAGLHSVSLEGVSQWTFETEGPVDAAPLVIGSVAYFGARDNRIWAVDAVGGTPIWAATTAGPVASTPVAVGDDIVVGSSDGRVYRLNRASGEPAWSWSAKAAVRGVAARGDTLYVAAGRRLVALSTKKPEVQWQFDLGAPVETPPTVAAGRVFVGTARGDVVGLDADAGSQAFRIDLGSPIRGAIAAGGGSLYIPATAGGMQTLSTDGEPRWEFRTDGLVTTSVVPVSRGLYVVDEDGSLYALR